MNENGDNNLNEIINNNQNENIVENNNTINEITPEKPKKSGKIVFVIVGLLVVIIALLAVVLFLLFGNKKEDKSNNSNNNSETTEKEDGIQGIVNAKKYLSFNSMIMNKDTIELSKEKKQVLEYFDDTYLYFDKSTDSATNRYPSLFKNMKVTAYGIVNKIISFDDNNYSAILEVIDNNGGMPYVSNVVYITGKQQIKRFAVNDKITIYGTYNTSILQNYKGKDMNMASITVSNWVTNENKFDNDQLREIARTLFGENIKFGEITGCAYNPYCEGYPVENNKASGLKVKLEDPKNSNYTEFNIYRSGSIFEVGYCNASNYMTKCEKGVPTIVVAADFKHFLVISYETATGNDGTAYLEYYDTSFNKIWRYEVDKINKQDSHYKGYLDYNANAVLLVMDGYLNYISIKDGKKITEPVMLGKDHSVYMLDDVVLLTGIDKKDYIEIMDYEGKITKKYDLKSQNIVTISGSTIQKVDDGIIVVATGYDNSYNYYEKIIKLDKNFDIIAESDEISI